MLGAIIGDICGSIYEFDNRKTDRPETIDLANPACFYTDDTVLTVAVAEAAFGDRDYEKAILKWARAYPKESYGASFRVWFSSDNPRPYNSFGNGAAMRVSPVGWAFDSLEETLSEAEKSAACTHNHPEGIKGAKATAAAIFLARNGDEKEEIKAHIEKEFGYDLSRSLADIRPAYQFDETCQGTVPQAITAFLESRDFSHAVQCAISIGGDSDTLAAITGSIAEAYYAQREDYIRLYPGMPKELVTFAKRKINADMVSVICGYYRHELKEAVRMFTAIQKAKAGERRQTDE
ncbi:MAG: ADP-ribosylglycohydrolase family protein [Spirochaetes bacterium]|nr:ADP-ribosylglycohydrolase family protein [Spirochaetota bacterium]